MKPIISLAAFIALYVISLTGYAQSIKTDSSRIEKIFDNNPKHKFYMINVAAYGDADSAIAKVREMRVDYKAVNYVWLPDYESLANKPLYVVFLGPYTFEDSCVRALTEFQKKQPDAYAVLAQHSKTRIVIRSWSDIRVDGVRQFLILTYAVPEDEKEYYDEGGEDWGFSQQDVWMYFSHYYPESVTMGSIYNGNLTGEQIRELEEELNLSGFGYILINGNEKVFIDRYYPQTSIIDEASGFFGLEIKPFPFEDE